MRLRLIEHSDPRLFRDAVLGTLMQSEVEYCAIIGLVQRLADIGYTPVSAEELDRPLLLTIEDDQRIELVGVQTLKRLMVITHGSPQARQCLAQTLSARNWTGSEIVGPVPEIEELARYYANLTNRPCRRMIQLRVFQLSAVTWPTPSPGRMRLCTPADRDLLARFIAAYTADIGEPAHEDSVAAADRLILDRRVFFWEDRRPVTMAAWAGRTPNGVRVNFVYTPNEFRRRGYASNLVAHLTQRLLHEGCKFCFLFTDQANPTSSSIYQKLGYRPVADSERWRFEAAS
jgi:hypothetical protein